MKNKVSFYEYGNENSLSLFMLHGAYGDGEYFRPMAERLAGLGFRVVVWNCPGYGESLPLNDNTIEAFASVASSLIESEGTQRNVILGHSMGALIAPLVANSSSNVDGVILSAASAGFASRSESDQKRYIDERLGPILNDGLTVSEYVSPLLRSMLGPKASGPDVELVKSRVLAMSTDALVTSIRAITAYDGRPALKSLSVPTLLLAGQHDPACPPEGMKLMDSLIDNSSLIVMSDVGHYAFAESADVYQRHVTDFLSTFQ